MAMIRLSGNDIRRGKTVWSIIRRYYGKSKRLYIRLDRDPNSPYYGAICYSEKNNSWTVLHKIIEIEGPLGIDNEGCDWDKEL